LQGVKHTPKSQGVQYKFWIQNSRTFMDVWRTRTTVFKDHHGPYSLFTIFTGLHDSTEWIMQVQNTQCQPRITWICKSGQHNTHPNGSYIHISHNFFRSTENITLMHCHGKKS